MDNAQKQHSAGRIKKTIYCNYYWSNPIRPWHRRKGGGCLAGFAHMVKLISELKSNSSNHRKLGPDYLNSTVRQLL
ncbi:MAG: hypothetical protein EBT92_15485 [Planctomycetes bacterium]|nr:hypothetical protein [Planctomycetota bacterium]